MLPFRDHNPTRSFPIVTILLIVLNVLVFLYMLNLRTQSDAALNDFVMRVSVIPNNFLAIMQGKAIGQDTLHPVLITALTALFLHGSFLHLAGNMLYLWIFGNNIEDIMGSGRFLLFYIVCGLIATAAYIVTTIVYTPDAGVIPSLGASGAIAGVLGAYLVRFPRVQVDSCLFIFIFVTIVRLPAFIVLAGWFVLQLFQGVLTILPHQQSSLGGVAFWAHIGGFVAGMLLVFVFQKQGRFQ